MTRQNQTIELNAGFGIASRPVGLESGLNAGMERFTRGAADSQHKVERSIDFMVANLNRPLQVATLAAQANVSPSHFFALFKQRTGYPPMDYFTKLRMHHACRLLDSTTARVKEVAAALGYDDPFYFSRVFKSVSAVAPVHYRGLGMALRREIKSLLEPKEQSKNGDTGRKPGLGRAIGRSGPNEPFSPQQNQQKTNQHA